MRRPRCLCVSILAAVFFAVGFGLPADVLARGVDVNDDQIAAVGIAKHVGRYLTLYTDDRDREDIAELVTVFDLAVKQWCEHFNIKESDAAGWEAQAFLMVDETKFNKAGLIPNELPKFLAGYALRNDLWLYPQPGNYYTRHLLLHEGTHAFMNHFLGDFGPPWYSEGMAEWLGLHRWDAESNKLQLGYRPRSREETSYWGRVKIVRDQLQKEQGMTLDDVFAIGPYAFQKVQFYGWAWAACEFLTHHPLTAKNFSRLDRHVSAPTGKFRRWTLTQLNRDQRQQLERDWRLFIHELDYGSDVVRAAVTDATSLPPNAATGVLRFRLVADRSWQRTGIAVRKGDRLTLTGQGRYTVKMTHQPWPCEAGGVTLRYYSGRPLGRLMAAVLPKENMDNLSINQPLVSPLDVGYQATVTADKDGVLCLRINESPADLADNLDGLEVTVEKLK